MRLKSKCYTWVNVAGFHHPGNSIIQGRLMSRYQVLVQRK